MRFNFQVLSMRQFVQMFKTKYILDLYTITKLKQENESDVDFLFMISQREHLTWHTLYQGINYRDSLKKQNNIHRTRAKLTRTTLKTR